jgi:5'-nucleotidase
MHILVSNDDGYTARGLAVLVEALQTVAEVTVVAPDRDRSGASNSLTLTRPLRMKRASNDFYFVDGTPTDCVHLALRGALDCQPDLVVSGINAGANLGDDVIYSGTVAAAMEGRFLGSPAIAVSLASKDVAHYETAAQVALHLVRHLTNASLPSETVLNVNVPDVPMSDLAGFSLARLGQRHKSEPVHRTQDPRGGEVFWIGAAGAEADTGPGTDFHAIRSRQVAITPLHTDFTHTGARDATASWLAQVEADQI